MQNEIYPCLWFDGNAKQAAAFYCSIFPDSKITTDTPMVVNWELWGKKFMGLNGGPIFKINPSISIFVNCKTVEQTDEIYNELAAGGEPLMAIGKYDWSERYGWIKDKFGVTWQIMLSAEEKICPALLFTGNNFGRAEEAMKLYTGIFDNSSIGNLQLYPDGSPFAGKVLFSESQLNNYNLIAMDGAGEHAFTFNEGISFVVECKDQAEIDSYWDKLLADGGKESQCGWLKDKFGLSWQIIPANIGKIMTDPEKGQRAMAAMMKMVKIYIATLENA